MRQFQKIEGEPFQAMLKRCVLERYAPDDEFTSGMLCDAVQVTLPSDRNRVSSFLARARKLGYIERVKVLFGVGNIYRRGAGNFAAYPVPGYPLPDPFAELDEPVPPINVRPTPEFERQNEATALSVIARDLAYRLDRLQERMNDVTDGEVLDRFTDLELLAELQRRSKARGE